MYFDLQTTPQFSVCWPLATFIISCGILHRAWEEIKEASKSSENFCVKEDGDVAYVTFPSFSEEDFFVTDSTYGEYSIKNEKIFSVCLKGDADRPALVHKGALNQFRRILERPDFKDKMKNVKAQTVIFVGHSVGGAAATLATLCYLQKRAPEKSYFCITFGAPLVGNSILGQAIGHEGWAGKFCHVVSNYDIVPRVLLAPLESISEPLTVLVPHWWAIMVNDCVAVHHTSIAKAQKTLLEKVQQCTSIMADKLEESDLASPYRPFGTYMFLSSHGAACIDDPETVLKMLHFTMQGMPSDQFGETCALEHTGYGQMLKAITNGLLNLMPIADFARDSFEMGIALALKAMNAGPHLHLDASHTLKKATVMKNKQDAEIKKLKNDFHEMQSCMAEVYFYRKDCKMGSGYYDCFKENPDRLVDEARLKLQTFLKLLVELVEKHAVTSEFRWQIEWIGALTEFRRLLEPLEIAHHYGTHQNGKSYISDEVRQYYYRALEKWKEENEQTDTGGDKEERTNFVYLTEDSCFWARLEDARQTLTRLQLQQDPNLLSSYLFETREFEKYIFDRIREKSISVEVFLEGSSFMNWWQQYVRYLQLQFPPFMLSSTTAAIHDFIRKENWN